MKRRASSISVARIRQTARSLQRAKLSACREFRRRGESRILTANEITRLVPS